MRGALEDLVGSVGLQVRPFASPQDFLQSQRPDAPGCLVLDVRLPGMSGLAFQKELARLGVALPVIFITGHGDIPMSVRDPCPSSCGWPTDGRTYHNVVVGRYGRAMDMRDARGLVSFVICRSVLFTSFG
jgi:hypothetical protein